MAFVEPGANDSYMELAKAAASQFVDLMFDDDQLGVVSFDDVIDVPHPLAVVDSSSKDAAKQAIGSLYARGATSIGGGLEAGLGELTSKGLADHPWAMVLLSDGKENWPPWVYYNPTRPNDPYVMPDITATKTVVHTIALGPSSAQALMLDIASETGGTYNVAPTASQLQAVYNTIAAAVTGQQTLLSLTGIVQPGATDQKSVVIDSTIAEATFSISWSGSTSTIDLTLEDPNGNAIDPTVAASNPDIDYVSGSTYAYYRIRTSTLITGVWKMMITGGSIPLSNPALTAATNEEQYTALVAGRATGAGLTLRPYFDQPSYSTNEPIKLSVTLSDDRLISGAEVVAIVGPLITVGPSPQLQTPADGPNPILVLYDDGLHGDGLANNGVYANTLDSVNTANAGAYAFQVFATGTSNNGDAFARWVQQNVNVGLDAGSATPAYQEFTHHSYLPLIMRP